MLKQFLKAGYLDKGQLLKTETGVPQGGTISPTIANMTLDGLTDVVQTVGDNVKKEAQKIGRGVSPWVHLVRYADDFVVTAASKWMIQGPITAAVNAF